MNSNVQSGNNASGPVVPSAPLVDIRDLDSVVMAEKAARLGMSVDELRGHEHRNGVVVVGVDGTPMIYDHSKDGPGAMKCLYDRDCP
jgi:hypothetical protein